MKTFRLFSIVMTAAATPWLLAGCATLDHDLGNGKRLQAILAAQTNDAQASERHGSSAPQGTDPEVAASAVRNLRERGADGAKPSGLFDVLLGGAGSK
jgi:hypothetical protein